MTIATPCGAEVYALTWPTLRGAVLTHRAECQHPACVALAGVTNYRTSTQRGLTYSYSVNDQRQAPGPTHVLLGLTLEESQRELAAEKEEEVRAATFGRNLRRIRLALQQTPRQFGAPLFLSPAEVSSLEAGSGGEMPDVAPQIAKRLGTTAEVLTRHELSPEAVRALVTALTEPQCRAGAASQPLTQTVSLPSTVPPVAPAEPAPKQCQCEGGCKTRGLEGLRGDLRAARRLVRQLDDLLAGCADTLNTLAPETAEVQR
jgi:transcriptional regulator with XRE-family HTH domain